MESFKEKFTTQSIDGVEITRNSRRNVQLHYNGRIYNVGQENGQTASLRCKQKQKCAGSALISRGIIAEKNCHTCEISAISAKVAKAKNMIQDKAMASSQSSKNIVVSVVSTQDDETIANLPNRSTMTRTVRSVRSGSTQSANFQHVSEIFFGDEIFYEGENILIHDSG